MAGRPNSAEAEEAAQEVTEGWQEVKDGEAAVEEADGAARGRAVPGAGAAASSLTSSPQAPGAWPGRCTPGRKYDCLCPPGSGNHPHLTGVGTQSIKTCLVRLIHAAAIHSHVCTHGRLNQEIHVCTYVSTHANTRVYAHVCTHLYTCA